MFNNIPILKSVYRSHYFKGLAVLLAFIVAVSGIYYFFYFKNLNEEYIKLNTEQGHLRIQLLSLKSLNSDTENLQSLVVNIQKINKKMSSHVDSIKLNKLILELSNQNRISINRQKHSEITKNEKWQVFKQVLNLQGNYRQIRKFINNIYRLPSLTLIETANFQKKSASNRQLSVTITLLTYQSKDTG